MSTAELERQEVFFSGHVQGVGFRYSAQQVAKEFDVAGFIENLVDGRVHLVVEGERKELSRFLSTLKTEMATYIGETNVTSGPATREFKSFDVRR